MTSTSTVTLKTERGWQHTTTLDDPIFADILAPYIDLGETPEEVLLEGSVAEVIEKSWPMWKKMETAMEGDKAPADAGVLTQDFLHFARILNLPSEWKLFVTLDRGWMSGEERMRHYREVGELIAELGIVHPTLEQITPATVGWISGMLSRGELESVLKGMRWESLVRNESSVALLAMDWEPFLTRVKSECADCSLVINTIELLLGRGDLRKADLFGGMEMAERVLRPSIHAKAMYKALVRNLDPRDGWTLSELGLYDLPSQDGHNSAGLLFIHRVHRVLMARARSITPYGRASGAAHIFFDQLDRESVAILLKLIEPNLRSLDPDQYEHFSTFSQHLDYRLQHDEE